jgi:hypothetical protein
MASCAGTPAFSKLVTAVCRVFLEVADAAVTRGRLLTRAVGPVKDIAMLRDGDDYHDLGAAHFPRGDHARLVAGLTRRLHHLGYEVTLRPTA